MTTTPAPFPRESFRDVVSGNRVYAESFATPELSGWANRGLAVVTCMDSRIDPLRVLGMSAGDVKILRNAGARVTEDVLRTLVLATYLLGVTRVLIMPHTDCKMASATEEQIHEYIRDTYDVDTRSVEIRTVTDQVAALRTDVTRVRSYPLLPSDVMVGGAIFNVHTGLLELIDA